MFFNSFFGIILLFYQNAYQWFKHPPRPVSSHTQSSPPLFMKYYFHFTKKPLLLKEYVNTIKSYFDPNITFIKRQFLTNLFFDSYYHTYLQTLSTGFGTAQVAYNGCDDDQICVNTLQGRYVISLRYAGCIGREDKENDAIILIFNNREYNLAENNDSLSWCINNCYNALSSQGWEYIVPMDYLKKDEALFIARILDDLRNTTIEEKVTLLNNFTYLYPHLKTSGIEKNITMLLQQEANKKWLQIQETGSGYTFKPTNSIETPRSVIKSNKYPKIYLTDNFDRWNKNPNFEATVLAHIEGKEGIFNIEEIPKYHTAKDRYMLRITHTHAPAPLPQSFTYNRSEYFVKTVPQYAFNNLNFISFDQNLQQEIDIKTLDNNYILYGLPPTNKKIPLYLLALLPSRGG